MTQTCTRNDRTVVGYAERRRTDDKPAKGVGARVGTRTDCDGSVDGGSSVRVPVETVVCARADHRTASRPDCVITAIIYYYLYYLNYYRYFDDFYLSLI